jgi:hypothetical protein
MRKNKNQKEVKEESSSDTESDDVYDVEKIVNKRTVRGKVEYFLKWRNYPE